jgi:tetratricopeptide (TPR) repeat protein
MVDNAASWKCITKECALIAPLNDKVRKIYDIVENEIEHTEEYNCGKFFDAFCIPPYGLSEETAAMFIGIVLVDMWHNVRILYNEDRMTVTDWKDNIVAEKKININAFRESTILWVDTGSIEAKFKRLFDKINNNQSIDEAGSLKEELEKMVSFYGLPESQEIYYRFAKKRFSEFETAKRSWENQIGSIQDDLAYALKSRAEFATGMLTQAKTDNLKAIEINDCPEYQFDRAKILYKEGLYREAKEIFKNLLSQNQTSKIYEYMGLCDIAVEDYKSALMNFDKAILLSNNDEYLEMKYNEIKQILEQQSIQKVEGDETH